MTEAEVLSIISGSPELKALIPDTAAIAAAISADRKKLVHTEIGNGSILQAMGITQGNAVLDFIYTHNDFRHVRPMLEQGRLRLDAAMTLQFLQLFVAQGLCTQESANALIAMAQVPDPIDEMLVRRALWSDDGVLQIEV